MISKNKKQKQILSKMKKEIKQIIFKIDHKSVEKIKNEIKRRGKIAFCKGRLVSPYFIALTISISSFSIFGATPFILDKRKNYEKNMKEIDSNNNFKIISQYNDFEDNYNSITLYEKWQENDDNTYSRNIKIYKLEDLTEEKITELLKENVNNIEEFFENPISECTEIRNNLDKTELDKGAYLSARIYTEDKNEFIYVNQPVSKNIGETIGWFFTLITLETIAFLYRGLSSFNYKKSIKEINNKYSKEALEILEKRLKIKEENYNILKSDNQVVDNNISPYLDKEENIQLTKLSRDELKNILLFATTIELPLRKKLTFDKIYTYGTEIELENVKTKYIKEYLSKYESLAWILKKDYSLHKGIEIVSPVLYDTNDCWKELQEVCESTKKLALVDKNCGAHVHVGAHILGRDTKAWLNFIKLWSVYENIIFRFAYGEFLNYRDSIIEYAPPISKGLWQDYQYLKKNNADLKEILYTIKYGKYYAVNFKNVKQEYCDKIKEGNTIEIRCCNGTQNAIIWQNYINFLLALFRYAKSDQFNDDILNKRHEQYVDIYDNIEMYNEIYLDQALELCDLIFDNNEDKIYFLNQYLKDFKIDYKKFDKNKTFTKKLKK